jgi:hypothetical protein
MKIIRPFLVVILIVFPVGILVLIRSMAPGNFKPDANKRAGASFTTANILNREQVAGLAGKSLFVKLDANNTDGQINSSSDTLFLAVGHLLEKPGLKVIHSHRGPVILVSKDPAISAKAWMILSQMGYRDLYVLSEEETNEVLKYKFRPDTAAGI